jgi:YfiH family protein
MPTTMMVTMAISTSPDSYRADQPLNLIRPEGFHGAAFAAAGHGDVRTDAAARRTLGTLLDLPDRWAYASQVHGNRVAHVTQPGSQGEADALYVDATDLPVTVATADCVPVIIEAEGAVAVVHAGWRGAVAGVLEETLAALEWSGHPAIRAAIGPAIGPCCYEVGPEVTAQFADFTATTTWGTPSVDIAGLLESRLEGIEVWRSDVCTYTDPAYNSHRRDGTRARQVAVGWLPQD